MVPVAQLAGDQLRMLLEVHARDGWFRREARTVDDQELETIVQRQLSAPGRVTAHHAPVDEDEALHDLTILFHD